MNDDRQRRMYARLDQSIRDEALKALLQFPAGRKYLWWLLEIGGIGKQPYSRNALDTAFNCGTLDVGQQILAHITEVDPAGFVQMQKESQDEWNTRFGNNSSPESDDAGD